MKEANSRVEFPSTCWSRVARAGDPASPEARASLALLCEAYWEPIYQLVRRKVRRDDLAQDLTQAFFVKILEKGTFARADRARGRFRTFLRASCVHFLIDQARRSGPPLASIDARDEEGRLVIEPEDVSTPDRLFERAWALTLLDRVLDRLAREYAESGRADTFEHLKVVLTEGRGVVPAATLAARLDTTEDAVHQRTYRLKVRYREILQEEIAATLEDPSEVADEIRSLFVAVRG